MQHQSLDSSWLKSAGYDPVRGLLEIETKDGRHYRSRSRIDEGDFKAIAQAKSPGTKFNRLIRGEHEMRPTKKWR